MKKIKVIKKTTFYNINHENILIFDFRGIEFYNSKYLNHIPLYFNLPKGIYYTNNSFKVSKRKKLNYKIGKLPNSERKLIKNNYKVKFDFNPHKASIFHKGKNKGLILIDYELQNKPLYMLDFILYHELGHNHYKTEWKADLFAVKQMLKKGYNPSQISLAPIQSLKNINFSRKSKVVNTLKNIKK